MRMEDRENRTKECNYGLECITRLRSNREEWENVLQLLADIIDVAIAVRPMSLAWINEWLLVDPLDDVLMAIL